MTKDEIKKRTANLIIKHKEQSADWLYTHGYTSAADYETSMLIARIAELEAALKPFADMADEYDAAFPRPLNICLAEYPEDYLLWCQARAAYLGEKE